MIKDIIETNRTVDDSNIKIKQLKEIFPGAFHGDTVDFDYLKKQLNNIKITQEGYELNFLGKSYAKLLTYLDTETVIVPETTHNTREENKNSENVYIVADNIDALKHLLKSYWRTFKAVYIDPPYNTGSDGFVYNDTFGFTKESLIEKLGINDDEAERIIDMTNNGSSSHSAWLTFMYPRLYIAKQLLREDGVIFISIGENEVFNLKLICDEIFGENNFLSSVTRVAKRTSNKGTYFKPTKDHILVYAKSIEQTPNFFLKKEIKETDYKFKDELGLYRLSGASLYQPSLDSRPNQRYYIEAPDGSLLIPPGEVFPIDKKDGSLVKPKSNIDKVWRWSRDTYIQKKSMLHFTKSTQSPLLDENGEQAKWNIYDKVYIENDMDKEMLPEDIIYDFPNSQGTKELNEIDIPFSFSKPSDLVAYLLRFINGENDMHVLDFFAGSSSTAHAVLKLNAEDGGRRKFFMIQLPEPTKIDSEEYVKGYKTIDEIGIERIKRSAKQIYDQLSEEKSKSGFIMDDMVDPSKLDFGFKLFRVQKIHSNQLKKLESFNQSVLFIDRGILDQFGNDTVLTTWKNLDGYGLTKEWTVLKLAEYIAYQIDGTIYLLNPKISNEAIKALIESYDDDSFYCNKIIMFGYSFTLSEIQSIKDNLKQVESIRHITLDIIVRY